MSKMTCRDFGPELFLGSISLIFVGTFGVVAYLGAEKGDDAVIAMSSIIIGISVVGIGVAIKNAASRLSAYRQQEALQRLHDPQSEQYSNSALEL